MLFFVDLQMWISPEQCRAGRALLGWSQDELAERSHVSKRSIAGFESGARAAQPRTALDLQRALEAAGIHFLMNDADGGVGVRFSQPSPEPNAETKVSD